MNRSLFTVLDRCVAVFLIVSVVTVGLAYLKSHKMERTFWENQIAKNYQFPVSQVVATEFGMLREQVALKANLHALFDAIEDNQYSSLTRLFASRKLTDESVDMVYVQNANGIGIYSHSTVYSGIALNVSALLSDQKAMDKERAALKELSPDHGLLFIDGRIYMYASALISRGGYSTGLITWVKEVNRELTQRVSKILGHQLAFHFTSAAQQRLRVSYRNDIEIELVQLQETELGFDIEYQGRLKDGSVQPANLVLSIELSDKPSSIEASTGWLMVFVAMIIWVLWLQLRLSLLSPIKQLQTMVKSEGGLRLAQVPDDPLPSDPLPSELLAIYQRVYDLYSNARQQNVFNQQVVNAIGDAIITLNAAS
ncbi:CHASE4 domain-containing protein [Vibrio mexicanus]|uniref:CHASE4 domain-containing protein n=1 Tax=Vibrio mexicanus TaxID=1004326 RepID=UPI00063CC7FA|nr:CHASE4 domain-containing protein [Vibrio mexicanus]